MSTQDVDFKVWKRTLANLLEGRSGKVDSAHNGANESYQNAPLVQPVNDILVQNTDLLAQMNASWVANNYIATSVGAEKLRVKALDDKAKRDIYRLRQDSMQSERRQHALQFASQVVRIVLVAAMLVVAVILLAASSKVTSRTGVVLAIAIIAVAGAIVAMKLANVAIKRNDDWGHYYWKAGDNQQNAASDAASCPSSSVSS